MKYLVFSFFLLIESYCVLAKSHSVKIMSRSLSGKTLKIDLGRVNDLRVGDTGEISIQTGPIDAPSFKFLGSGKVVKIYQNYSYWYFPIAKVDEIKVKKDYVLQLRRETYKGRTDLPMRYNVVSATSDEAIQDRFNGHDSDLPSSLIGDDDVKALKVYDNKGVGSDELRLRKRRQLKEQTPMYIDSKPHDVSKVTGYVTDQRGSINQGYREQLAKDQNVSRLKKMNELKDGYEQLYQNIGYNQKKMFRELTPAELTKEALAGDKGKELDAKVIDMIKKEGDLWTADMDDREIAEFILKTGANSERARRSEAISFNKGAHEFSLFFSVNGKNNTSSEDQNYQNSGSSIGLQYELHLKRLKKEWTAWSLDVQIERGVVAYDVGDINAHFDYGSLASHLNYYFYNYPHSRKKLAWFLGFGLKRGVGSITSPNFSDDYDMVIQAMPSAHIGFKYRVPTTRDYDEKDIGYGISARLSAESLSLDTTDVIEDDINPNQNVTNFRYDIGISFYF